MKFIYDCLISKEVQQFYRNSFTTVLPCQSKFFKSNKSFDFEEIFQNLQETNKEDLENWNYNAFLNIYDTLLPIFVSTEIVAKNLIVNEAELSWLGSNYQYLQLNQNHETCTVEYILLATSLLEHSLGSIYCTVSRSRIPPYLLKDLLATDELQSFFDKNVILFLRLLLGIPEAINLRNIVWHGFSRPADVPNYYATVMLITLHSLGCIINQKQFNIIYRQQIQDYSSYSIELKLKKPAERILETIKRDVENCNWLNCNFKAYWYQLFEYYAESKFWQFVLLILPQIELLLRLKYSSINDFDVRAKLFEYYITIDTIFDSKLPLSSSSNSLESALKCIYDWFVAPNGPRLRNKVSHGEVALKAIDNIDICNALLLISINLFEDQINNNEFSYESQLHKNSVFSRLLNENYILFYNFENKHLKSSKLYENLPEKNIQIFVADKRESELMSLLLKIAREIQKIVCNYEASVAERGELLRKHQLHSKRRRTFEKLLTALPQIFEILYAIQNNMKHAFHLLQKNKQHFNHNLRFYKKTLQICQNLAKYAHKESNEWIRAVELCDRMQAMFKEL